MTRGKWMLLLALLLGTLLLIGCGSKEEEKTPAPAAEQTQNTPAKEEPKAEAPKAEEPKAEAPKAEAPKVEAPKAEAPKAEAPTTTTTTKKTLNLGHDLGATYANNCATCHAGGAIFTKKPPHNIDASTLACTTCHTLNPKS